MRIITLTTDLGLADHYVASIKGQLYSHLSNVQIVDISHDVQPFNIGEAAYYINNVIEDFPEGTIHFIGVDSLPMIAIGNPDNNMYPIISMRSQLITLKIVQMTSIFFNHRPKCYCRCCNI